MLGDNLTAKQLEILQAIRAGPTKEEQALKATESKKEEAKTEPAVEWKKIEKPVKAPESVDKEGGK